MSNDLEMELVSRLAALFADRVKSFLPPGAKIGVMIELPSTPEELAADGRAVAFLGDMPLADMESGARYLQQKVASGGARRGHASAEGGYHRDH